jgi:soluble lytic murein transglycosylase-like protein
MADLKFKGLLDAVIKQESQGDPMAVSSKGAIGLAQLLPETAMQPGYGVRNIFDVASDLGVDAVDRDENTATNLLRDQQIGPMMGANYLSGLLRAFDGDVERALVAYNWGPSNARDWSGKMSDLPGETRNYLGKVREYYRDMVGTALPRTGLYDASIYSTRPAPRPSGLLE